jgi:hypothetical protein
MSSDPSEERHSFVLPTAKVLPQRPIRPDVDIDDVEACSPRAFRIPLTRSPIQATVSRKQSPGHNRAPFGGYWRA